MIIQICIGLYFLYILCIYVLHDWIYACGGSKIENVLVKLLKCSSKYDYPVNIIPRGDENDQLRS